MESLLFISDISKKTGLSIHTLRYYEQIGLLKNIHRNQSGRRVYTKLDLEWLEWKKCKILPNFDYKESKP
ncbi:unnamed protein product [Oppiella nova]|uniref:HTH merR-type domain-containing protein n=1 Tax=Oppiella nova TaxID=334625 RepID=A0A7R9LH97_9ACAR|nr:unnamed protein product [Oppiella nova]CAG2162931.1 unnamed protein product [Oppiella nova]